MVGRIDMKIKLNAAKQKLKLLLKNIDKEKKGEIKAKIFFELVALHNLDIDDRTKAVLLRDFRRSNDMINYNDAIAQITMQNQSEGSADHYQP